VPRRFDGDARAFSKVSLKHLNFLMRLFYLGARRIQDRKSDEECASTIGAQMMAPAGMETS